MLSKIFSKLKSMKAVLLVATGVFAMSFSASASASTIWYDNLFTPAKSDLSIYWLSQIFGSVGGMLPYHGPGLLPAVFQVFNAIMLIFVALMAVYGVMMSLVNAASQGSMMSKTMSSPVYPIRLIIGLAAVAPLPSGYSAVQMFIMWVILQGVGAADVVWHRAVDYFAAGGSIVQQEQPTSTGLNSIGNKNAEQFIQNVYSAGMGLAAKHETSSSIAATPLSMDYVHATENGVTIDGAGTFTVQFANDLSPQERLSITQPIAQLIYQAANTVQSAQEQPKDAQNLINRFVLNSWDAYKNVSVTYTGYTKSDAQKADGVSPTGKQIYDMGWANAGAYYHDLAKQKAEETKGAAIVSNYSNYMNYPSSGVLNGAINQLPIPKPDMGNQAMLCGTSGFVSAGSMLVGNIPLGTWMLATCGALAGLGSHLHHMYNSSGMTGDPILNIMSIGQTLVNAIEASSIAFIVASGLLTLTTGAAWGLGFNPVYGIAMEGASFLPMLISLTLPLLAVGYTLMFYVPMVPFMIFATGVLGWLMICIESMIAAPITMVGLVSPDGQHEVFGRAEPAIMLIFNTFLRPTLMIFGFLSAMLLSHIVFEIVNAGFYQALSFISFSNISTGIFAGIVVLVLYNTFVIGLINQVFKLIHMVPDKVMTWVGHNHSSMINSDEVLQGAKGGVSEAVGSAGKMLGNSAQTSGEDSSSNINQNRDNFLNGEGEGATIGGRDVRQALRNFEGVQNVTDSNGKTQGVAKGFASRGLSGPSAARKSGRINRGFGAGGNGM